MEKLIKLLKEAKQHIGFDKQVIGASHYNNSFIIHIDKGIEKYENVRIHHCEPYEKDVHLYADADEGVIVLQIMSKPEFEQLFPDLAKEVFE